MLFKLYNLAERLLKEADRCDRMRANGNIVEGGNAEFLRQIADEIIAAGENAIDDANV